MSEYSIRFAKQTDLEQIVQLCAAHADFEKANYNSNGKLEALNHHLFQSKNNLKCLVIEIDKELVGYATFIKQFSTWDANYYVYLDCLFLKEDTRGKGLGQQLMTEVKAFAKAENCDIVQWQTPNFNKNAIVFYKKIGATSKSKERFSWYV